MRAIHLARLDKQRPALLLTREIAILDLNKLTVAPITSTIRGIATEVRLGTANGLDHDCVVTLDSITSIPAADIGPVIGYLLDAQEQDLTAALFAAFDLE